MATKKRAQRRAAGKTATLPRLAKAQTGITGLDEITDGGLPRGKPTLVCGGAGCGKSLLAMEFLIRGATEFHENGVFIAFEETPEDLAANVASLGFDLKKLEREKKIAVDYVYLERSEIEETGEYDLEGLFVRLELAIKSVNAKRVVLDTIETLFSGLSNLAVLRAELRRLFRWLRERQMTLIVTGERGNGALTRSGLEEYVSDCVIFLDHRVTTQLSTRRLRIVKYRGSRHGTNEYPFLIDEGGLSVLPITSLGLAHRASHERVPTGVHGLDEMLDHKGYFRGTTILSSGTAGTGKTSMAASFVAAACHRGERALYFSFEESAEQLARNMRSIGVDLVKPQTHHLLRIIAGRPTVHGLEMHLVKMHRVVNDFAPNVVVIDPLTSLMNIGGKMQTQQMLTRLIDFLKTRGVTTMFTSLSGPFEPLNAEESVSSLVDTWLAIDAVIGPTGRRPRLRIIKSRGMPHSTLAREVCFSKRGVELLDAA